MKLIEIVDVNGRKRLVKSVKVVNHEVRDAIHGGAINEKYVEVVVVGRYRKGEWKEWYPLSKFLKLNPDLEEKLKP